MPGRDLTVAVCGAPLTRRAPDLVVHLLSSGWRPTVVATPAAVEWLDEGAVERLTGLRPRTSFRAPGQPKAGPAAAIVVCPATFNTVNKAAMGAADTYALAQLCEGLGSGVPTVIVPMVNDKLWRHPAWDRNMALLRSTGVRFVDAQTGMQECRPVASGTGDAVVRGFDPAWVSAALPVPG